MEGTKPTTSEATGGEGNQESNQTVLLTSKPLHRFVQKEPKTLGVVILIFGCAELLMGFQLANETAYTSNRIYIPFWQGTLFLICGNLSIYTAVHPSKKMVTVCLAMYVVSLLGILVSAINRLLCFGFITDIAFSMKGDVWSIYRSEQLLCVEIILLISSLCVSVILIFLSIIARLALKSTQNQVIIQYVSTPPPPPPPQE